MPRKRIIDPEFWLDNEISKLTYKNRLLYIGLWTLADDFGILENDLNKIRASVFPYSNCKIDKEMAELIRLKKLEEYEVEGKKYFWVKNFLKYQWFSHPSHKFPIIPVISSKIQQILKQKGGNRERDELNKKYPLVKIKT